MTYDPQIPLVTESPSTSASPIQVNFDQFAKVFSQLVGGLFLNHIPFKNANQGKHAAVVMQKQTADPGVTENLTALYAKDATSNLSTEPQLFVQIPKFLPTNKDPIDAPNTPMQLTYNSVGLAGPVYYSFMPGGWIVYFGRETGIAVSPKTITIAPIPKILFVTFANPNTLELGGDHRPMKISTNITSMSTFDVYSTPGSSGSPANYDFSWFALGVA